MVVCGKPDGWVTTTNRRQTGTMSISGRGGRTGIHLSNARGPKTVVGKRPVGHESSNGAPLSVTRIGTRAYHLGREIAFVKNQYLLSIRPG